ncbi:nSTAND3 domain-containing NTPase [Mucilaginibacter ginkgonis]|uniref:Restriction endonuclease n=1 Tax=Mucilaginibacter ginkgonis TaxID=2682091 RepID=A0A6I4I032_9SPHI|nr:restriction endonuclease [Mucilaginibacter ginkgonis]QQL49906.1 restriction endonuclease [Mucilaginibacter ginkgonis]
MPFYHLEVLHDKEFEELSKDLLESELNISFQNFKSGADKGIDLRYAGTEENQIIVQAKRYIRTSFSKLKSELFKEQKKMLALSPRPKRYLLTTALDLSVAQIDEVVQLMEPFIKNSQDVYARERIHSMIANNPIVEKKFYKLWLTSTNTLQEILTNGASGRSSFIEEKIIRRASLYVPTNNFDIAVSRLRQHHFLIISGEPGIGKTTIAYLLICDMLAAGHQLIYVDDQIKDAEDMLSRSPDHKQVIFFDDFLGSNLSEIMNPRNSERKIVNFIERIQASPNKYFVLTTRTTILKQAQSRYENFNRSGLADLSKYELEIKAYSKLDKAKILYNHLFHSGIAAEQYDIFLQPRNYLRIINHKNYFPRLIEFVTSAAQLQAIKASETEEFIFSCLDNPDQIWYHAFINQLDDEERFVLTTLFSLGAYKVPSQWLERAFEDRYDYEIKTNGFHLKTGAFQRSVRKLLDGFIRSEKDSETGQVTFALLNPSVGDFLINYLRDNSAEVKRILNSISYFGQLTGYFQPSPTKAIALKPEQLAEYYPKYLRRLPTLIANDGDLLNGQLKHVYVLLHYFQSHITEDNLLKIIEGLDLTYAKNVDHKELMYVLSTIYNYDEVKKYITSHWLDFFHIAVETAKDSSDLKNIVEELGYYEIDDDKWSTNDDFRTTLRSSVNHLYSTDDIDFSGVDDGTYNYEGYYYSDYQGRVMAAIEDKVVADYDDFLIDCNLYQFSTEFYEYADIDTQSLFNNYMENRETHDEYDPGDRINAMPGQGNEDDAIRQLFER